MNIINNIINYLYITDIDKIGYIDSNVYSIIDNCDIKGNYNYKKIKSILKRIYEIPIIRYRLIYLNLAFNNIKKIENLPEGLLTLILHSNEVEKIENIPYSVIKLNFCINKIMRLENLPPYLEYLNISYNKIDILENLNKNLECLIFNANYIKFNMAKKYLKKILIYILMTINVNGCQ